MDPRMQEMCFLLETRDALLFSKPSSSHELKHNRSLFVSPDYSCVAYNFLQETHEDSWGRQREGLHSSMSQASLPCLFYKQEQGR